MSEVADLMKALQKTAYFQWMNEQRIPVVEAYGIEDVRELKLAPWERTGGKAALIHLYGMEGVTGMYVGEIAPGEALKPERHMYEEVICILSGQGATEAWQDGGKKHIFEWNQWSLFAPPLNSWHRLINGSREPVKYLAVTNAPLVMDTYHSSEFVFSCPFVFSDRFAGEEGYFNVGQKQYVLGMQSMWETNFIPNIKDMVVKDDLYTKGPEVGLIQFELAGNALIGHIADWPAGLYHKAHYHGPGAVLMILQSEGYTLIWPKDLGIHPFENGKGDQVVEIKWTEGSVFGPPGGWFHQHFNTGKEAARQLAIRYGSRINHIGFKIAAARKTDGVYISVKEGGTMIDYPDEDPEIPRRYNQALKRNGVISRMQTASSAPGGR